MPSQALRQALSRNRAAYAALRGGGPDTDDTAPYQELPRHPTAVAAGQPASQAPARPVPKARDTGVGESRQRAASTEDVQVTPPLTAPPRSTEASVPVYSLRAPPQRGHGASEIEGAGTLWSPPGDNQTTVKLEPVDTQVHYPPTTMDRGPPPADPLDKWLSRLEWDARRQPQPREEEH